jgi:hypothetical protein
MSRLVLDQLNLSLSLEGRVGHGNEKTEICFPSRHPVTPGRPRYPPILQPLGLERYPSFSPASLLFSVDPTNLSCGNARASFVYLCVSW